MTKFDPSNKTTNHHHSNNHKDEYFYNMPGRQSHSNPEIKANRTAEHILNTWAKKENKRQVLDPNMLTPSRQVKEGFMSLSELRRHGSKKR